jgi:syntaxin-binding protein 1
MNTNSSHPLTILLDGFLMSLVVESIEKRRQPYPQLEAIYFLSPTEDSIERFIEDFTGTGIKNPIKYAAAHLYFTSGTVPSSY